MKQAFGTGKAKLLVIDYDDPEYKGGGERLGTIEYEEFIAEGDPGYSWKMPDDEWDAITLNYTSGTNRGSQRRGLPPSRCISARDR